MLNSLFIHSRHRLIILSNSAFEQYVANIPGATYNLSAFTSNVDSTLLQIPVASVSSMQPLNFVIGGINYTLTVSQQLGTSKRSQSCPTGLQVRLCLLQWRR